MTNPQVILIGAGGHARVLLESLSLSAITLSGFVAPTSEGSRLSGVPYLGTDVYLESLDPSTVQLVNGIGSVKAPQAREKLFTALSSAGFSFVTVVDPRAVVSPSAKIADGAQVLVGAIIGAGAEIGANAIINSGAIVDHDSLVGAHSHISPGAVLAGDVTVGSVAHIGLGSRVIQGVTVGDGATVGAGAVVIGDVAPGTTVVGIPAR